MNSDMSAVDRVLNDSATSFPPPRKRSRAGLILFAMLLAFIGGIAATVWFLPSLKGWWDGEAPQTAAQTETLAQPAQPVAGLPAQGLPAPTPTPTTPLTVSGLEARMAALSARLDIVSGQADKAGGNAARAEGLLIAFATRRALDHGTSLGYLENELRLRFGDAQPKAVATIINAAHAPITLSDLQVGLDEVAPSLSGVAAASDWWTATKRELANLIIVRKAGEPSPTPAKTIDRARLLIETGRVDEAVRQIERLPDHQKADNWLQMARQYNEARRALDVVEAAAILEPRSVAANVRPVGQTVQVAPPPPGSAPAQPENASAARE